MSRIDELIEKLCPDGVEYKKLEEIVKEINIGINPRKFFKLNPIDATGFYVTVRELNGLQGVKQYDKTDKINDEAVKIINDRAHIEKGDILFSNTGTVGKLALVNETPNNWGVNEGIYIIKPLTDVILSKFLYYYLDSTHAYKDYSSKFTGSTLKHVTQKALLSLIVAVPPMEVQCEIVHALDDFTLLSAELSAELKAREKQYNYYKGKLFDMKNVELKTLKELATNCDNQRKPVTSSNREKGEYPYYGASGIVDYVKNYIFDGEFLLISEDGANLVERKTPIAFSISGKNWVNNHAHVLKFDDMFLQKYVEMYLNYISLEQYISGAAQPKLNQENLNKIVIPIPEYQTLINIVNILSKFDKITNDISEGLPAEIEARKKQYEFYRDKLLTFKEKVK